MQRVAFIFTGIGNISGGGGAERFFSDFFEKYRDENSKYKLYFVSDASSLKNLNAGGQLKNTKDVLTFKIFNNRFKNFLEAFQVYSLIITKRISLVQIPLYNIYYYPLIKAIDKMPAFVRPKIVYTVTDSFIPYFYFNDQKRGYNFKTYLGGLFETIKIDAVISWYKLFEVFSKENKLIKSAPPVYCINSRYTAKNFNTSTKKKNHIVFASRLTIAKQPLMFVEALNILKERTPLVNDWQFFIYGKGNLEETIRTKIKDYQLESILTLTSHPDLTKVFEESKCFVSTQDYENFPSLAMNEAMAAGNAIIARNVGQTNLFVKHGVNGLLINPDNETGLADALENYLKNTGTHQKMQEESLKLTEEVHTFSNFKKQIESFWDQTLNLN